MFRTLEYYIIVTQFWMLCALSFEICRNFLISTMAYRKLAANFKLNEARHPKSCYSNKVRNSGYYTRQPSINCLLKRRFYCLIPKVSQAIILKYFELIMKLWSVTCEIRNIDAFGMFAPCHDILNLLSTIQNWFLGQKVSSDKRFLFWFLKGWLLV